MSKIDQTIEQLVANSRAIKPSLHPALSFVLWGLITAMGTGLIAHFSSLRPDIDVQLHTPLFLAEVVTLFSLLVTVAFASIYLSYPDLRQNLWIFCLPLVPLSLYISLVIYRALHPEFTNVLPEDADNGLNCSLCITMYALLPGCLMFYNLRRRATTHPKLAGAISLILAASVGLLILKFLEGNDSVFHMIEWHLTPVLILGIVGMFLGSKYLSW